MNRLIKAICIMFFAVLIAGYFLLNTETVNATTNNKNIAIDYCTNYCINYEIKIVKHHNIPKNRINKKYVYIEKVKSKYLVYNPKSNKKKDIICSVSNKNVMADTTVIYRNVKCCNCDGTSNDCVYYIHNLGRHMTENEIADFEESEKKGW